jgi:hypothetical protein
MSGAFFRRGEGSRIGGRKELGRGFAGEAFRGAGASAGEFTHGDWYKAAGGLGSPWGVPVLQGYYQAFQ